MNIHKWKQIDDTIDCDEAHKLVANATYLYT